MKHANDASDEAATKKEKAERLFSEQILVIPTSTYRCLVGITIAAGLAGCAVREPPKMSTNVTSPAPNYEYTDLQPGWRIRVVTPILKSGKFIVKAQAVEGSGNETTLKTGNDFVGYEIAYYSIKTRPGGGVFIRFSSAESVRGGKPAKQSQPSVPLFDLPGGMRFVRLVFLTRVSRADHNQGILGASSLEQLNALTRNVEAAPAENCRTYADIFCSWIPAGIAAQPEKRDPVHAKEWVLTW
jgi:hypothetical protein